MKARVLTLTKGRAAWWLGSPLVLGLLVAVSLEEVTDDPPPLDPRFVQGGGTSAVGPGPGLVPFSDYEGTLVPLNGTLVADDPGALDLDLWQVDPTAPGSRTHLGKVPVEGPGPFTLLVPESYGKLQIESFRDQTGDGPSVDDPFGRVECEVGPTGVEGVLLVLEAGGMAKHHGGPPAGGAEASSTGGPDHVEMPPGGQEGGDVPAAEGAQHQEAAPGAPGGGEHQHVEAPPGAPGGEGGAVHDPDARPEGADPSEAAPPGVAPSGPGSDPFASVDGPRVTLSGTIVHADPSVVLDLDIFRSDSGGPGGRAFVGKKKLSPGPFILEIPRSFDKISLEVFLDANGDGPSADDPFATCPCNPVNLRKGDVDGLVIRVE